MPLVAIGDISAVATAIAEILRRRLAVLLDPKSDRLLAAFERDVPLDIARVEIVALASGRGGDGGERKREQLGEVHCEVLIDLVIGDVWRKVRYPVGLGSRDWCGYWKKCGAEG